LIFFHLNLYKIASCIVMFMPFYLENYFSFLSSLSIPAALEGRSFLPDRYS
jgi:hypothetical protein